MPVHHEAFPSKRPSLGLSLSGREPGNVSATERLDSSSPGPRRAGYDIGILETWTETSIFTPRFTRFPSISWLASTRIALEGPAVAAMAMSVVIATDSEAKLAWGCRVRSKGSFRGVTGCRPMSAYAQGSRVSYILACREPQFPGCFCDDAKIQ